MGNNIVLAFEAVHNTPAVYYEDRHVELTSDLKGGITREICSAVPRDIVVATVPLVWFSPPLPLLSPAQTQRSRCIIVEESQIVRGDLVDIHLVCNTTGAFSLYLIDKEEDWMYGFDSVSTIVP